MQRCHVVEIPSLLPPPHLAHLFPEIVSGLRGTGGGGGAVRAGRGCVKQPTGPSGGGGGGGGGKQGKGGDREEKAGEESEAGGGALDQSLGAECDDNDGVYLKGVFAQPGSGGRQRKGSLIQDCTFAHGADDAIDINGEGGSRRTVATACVMKAAL